ncbi:type II toxin-antitoxin system ParD family antitoxin [Flagellatimonas centrodinii]|nr:type II toxin-antitoxin system ParD family antitoxin [Flagellatimonas centrodinii]ULQ47563.1 type II toxin-antitoxin system ParD family antitoxin [Flagellatimonas centrodinii]
MARTPALPFFAKMVGCAGMTTMNISLPDALRAFVEARVAQGGYGTSSEYLRELIRKDQDRTHLRELLLAGAMTPPTVSADRDYFDRLRDGVNASP